MPFVNVNDLNLYYELDEPNGGPVLVLVCGLGQMITDWPASFLAELRAKGMRLLLFDNRDCGLSERVTTDLELQPLTIFANTLEGKESKVPYRLSDVASDVIGLIRYLNLSKVNLLGVSLGSMIAQQLAIEHSEFFQSITYVMSTTGAPDVGGATPEALAAIAEDRSYKTPEERLEHTFATQAIWGSPGKINHEELTRNNTKAWNRLVAAGIDPTDTNGVARQLCTVAVETSRVEALKHVEVPGLVIHGAIDPLIDISGGKALAEAMANAQFMSIAEMAHDLPDEFSPAIAAAVHALIESSATPNDTAGAATAPPNTTQHSKSPQVTGPLSGIKVVEVASIGPGPFCAMMLADMGAEVTRIDRPSKNTASGPSKDISNRGRKSIAIDLKSGEGQQLAAKMIAQADVVIEGFRPGVMERLGLGPSECLASNPALVYARMTGWGQTGPLAQVAGHDINYIALSGTLHMLGRNGEKPTPPINLVGDFGGGGMYLAFGVLAALLHARSHGEGQVVDAAMVEGAASLATMIHSLKAQGLWQGERGTNLLDTGAFFYDTYRCKDEKYISIGSLEPQFYALLIEALELDKEEFADQNNPAKWEERKEVFAEIFSQKTRDEWCEIMEYTDICFAPVLSVEEAYSHPHNAERQNFIDIGGVIQPAPTPRFSKTPPATPQPPNNPGENSVEVLEKLGFTTEQAQQLIDSGVVS